MLMELSADGENSCVAVETQLGKSAEAQSTLG